jgi:chromosome segregation ATPase
MAKWQCNYEQAEVARSMTVHSGHTLTDDMRLAITAAVGAEVDALRKSLAEMLEQARRYDAEVAAATARAEQAERDLVAMRGERDEARAMAVELEYRLHQSVLFWHPSQPHLFDTSGPERALVESWRADAERKDGAK